MTTFVLILRKNKISLYFLGISFLFTGAFLTNINYYKASVNLLKTYNNNEISALGYITDFPSENEKRIKCALYIQKIIKNDKIISIGQKVDLYLQKKTPENIGLECQDWIIIKGKFIIPEGPDYPGGFNYSKYLLLKNMKGIL